MTVAEFGRAWGCAAIALFVVLGVAGCGNFADRTPSENSLPPAPNVTEEIATPEISLPPDEPEAPTPQPDTVYLFDGYAELNGESHSLTDPNSIWMIVNKRTPINPIDFEPTDLVVPNMPICGNNNRLRDAPAAALEKLSQAAVREVGSPLCLTSGFRSFDTQGRVHRGWVASHGQERADTFSARPGFSEHQTGLAVDVTEVGGTLGAFGGTALGRWTTENAWRYGFIIRYTEENQHIAGFISEPWHLRYVGENMASYYHNTDALALENVFGFPPAPDYGD